MKRICNVTSLRPVALGAHESSTLSCVCLEVSAREGVCLVIQRALRTNSSLTTAVPAFSGPFHRTELRRKSGRNWPKSGSLSLVLFSGEEANALTRFVAVSTSGSPSRQRERRRWWIAQNPTSAFSLACSAPDMSCTALLFHNSPSTNKIALFRFMLRLAVMVSTERNKTFFADSFKCEGLIANGKKWVISMPPADILIF
mmetsp:Transcript_19755/g.40315  ORF Transcript_19755/g.40315 Transcript_19755/m.40315 type:complete len:200 (+) Transcript_19755:668-1267(+)